MDDIKRTLRGVQTLRDEIWRMLYTNRLPQQHTSILRDLLTSLTTGAACAQVLEKRLDEKEECIPIPSPVTPFPPEKLFSWAKHDQRVQLQKEITEMKKQLKEL